MLKHNANNERIKRSYFTYLKEAKRHSEPTVDAVAKSLARFESYNKYKDFKAFHYQQAVSFKNHLADQHGQRSGEKLSKATLNSTLANLKRFFQWLAGQPGYKSRMQYSDADYFNLSDKDTRIATAKREQKAPTLEQVKYVIASMPTNTEIELRNRALIAFTLLTGARDGAIASMKLKHFDLAAKCINQDAREVQTKFSKTFTTFFFPVGDDIEAIVENWVTYLRVEKLWGNDDPLFPSTLITVGESQQFEATGLNRKHWSNATPIRNIFRQAFTSAGLPYFNPHSLRDTIALLGETICKTPEEFKAWSQNIGHDKVLTTFYNYGTVSNHRQSEIIKSLSTPQKKTSTDAEDIAEAVFRKLLNANRNKS
jgi:integrase